MGEEYDENGADKKKAHRVPHSGRSNARGSCET